MFKTILGPKRLPQSTTETEIAQEMNVDQSSIEELTEDNRIFNYIKFFPNSEACNALLIILLTNRYILLANSFVYII